MASLKFYLDHPYDPLTSGKKKLKSKLVPVYLFVTFSRNERVRIKTDLSAMPGDWDFVHGRLRSGKYGSIEFNLKLNEIQTTANTILIKHSGQNYIDKKNELLSAFGKSGRRILTFFNVLDLYIEVRSTELNPKTIKKYQRLKIVLREIEKARKIDINFECMDLSFYDAFTTYLFTTGKGRKREVGYLDDTISKYVDDLKTFLNWCFDRGYTTNLSYKKFKSKRHTRVDNPILTLTELRDLYAFDFAAVPKLDRARDLFCFLCFTGQRVSDALNFNREDLDGDVWKFTQVKNETGKPVEMRIPLVGWAEPAMKILQKYDYILPDISEQRLNDYIKEAGEASGITSPVRITRMAGKDKIVIEKRKCDFMSTHMGRRTAVTLLLQMGVPPTTVMKITGHKKLETILKYENTEDAAVTSELSRIGELGYANLRLSL